MAERRSLVEGLKVTSEPERSAEEAFVFGKPPGRSMATAPVEDPPAPAAQGAPAAPHSPPPSLAGISRVALTTRVRPELAAAMKRISLQRQLVGHHPSAMQDLVEEALELWLMKHGTPV